MVTPSTATSALTPDQAATFASSQGELNFTNFSEPFLTIEKQNHADTFPVANGGIVEAQNIHAVINVTDEPPSVSTKALSQAFGNNKGYSGTATTQAKIVGNFDVVAGKLFSFEFLATLDLQTRINQSKVETAKASGNISFKLFDTTHIPKQKLPEFLSSLLSDDTTNSIQKSPLDFFSLKENLNTPSSNDSIAIEKSQNFTITSEDKNFDVGGTKELAKVSVKGSFQRSFVKGTNLTLIALRRSQVKVTA